LENMSGCQKCWLVYGASVSLLILIVSFLMRFHWIGFLFGLAGLAIFGYKYRKA